MEVTVAGQKTHFPQVPLQEVKQIMARQAACRRPANVTIEQRKGKDPYSVSVSPESQNVSRTLENRK
jgi:hypothetical protein